jgi:hypothetical protein
MFRVWLILRWVAALLLALITWTIVVALGAVIWERFLLDSAFVKGTIGLATFLGVLSGSIVVPRAQRKAAALTIWLLVVLYFLFFILRSALSGHFSLADFEAFGSALTGGFLAYLCSPLLVLFEPDVIRSVKKETASEARTTIWWLRRLLLTLLVLLCFGAMLVGNPYGIYTAWKLHTVGVRVFAWDFATVSYDAHPIAFWFVLVFDVVLVALLVALAAFLVWNVRFDRILGRKRKTRPPVDDAIRQSISER